MNCQDLAAQIEKFEPAANPNDVARFCLLLANTVEDMDGLKNEDRLEEAWKDINLKLQLATDQHAAMTEELEELARSDPREFRPEQIWILIRAIKVQSQILQMYLGQPALDV